MLSHYLRIALRRFRREKGYSSINILGLAVGMACCLLIGLYVQDEITYDRFHEKADRTFRVVETQATPDLGDRQIASTVGPVGPALMDEMPGVETATRFVSFWRMTVSRGAQRNYVQDYLIAEPSFFDVFSFPLLQGDPETALSAPKTIVLTESAVVQYFGDEDPMGQTIEIERMGDVTVTGVLADPPPNSHLQFSMLFPAIELATEVSWWNDYITDWQSGGSMVTYVVLDDPANASAVADQLTTLRTERQGPEGVVQSVALQPLTDVHFASADIEENHNHAERPITYLYVFGAIALLVLLIACINYMNLATARATQRAKEVGVRKAVGAQHAQLIHQLLGESVLTAVLALGVALLLSTLLLPAFNVLAGKSLALLASPAYVAGLVALTLGVGVLAGSYPAFVLSRMRPARVLKGQGVALGRGLRLRHGLVVTQFTLAILVIVATVVIGQQFDYIQTKRLGFNQDHLVVIDINDGQVRRDVETIRAEMAAVPGVERVSVSSRVPGDWKNITEIEARADGMDGLATMSFLGVDDAFLDTYEIALLSGRNLSEAYGADSSTVLLNETAARTFGLTDPIGQRIFVPQHRAPQDTVAAPDLAFTVVGIVEDFHFRSLHEAIGPLVLGYRNNPIRAIDYFTARISPGDVTATLAGLRAIGERFDPDHPFEYNFLDERLGDFYVAEAQAGRIVAWGAGLAVLIACLGLFGLAAFIAERRRKEIGVRKVLGASAGSIVLLLSRDFVRLVLVAAVIAAPLAYLGMQRWLDGFAYHVPLGPLPFLAAGGLALVLALATVSYQALRAATTNPVNVLHYE